MTPNSSRPPRTGAASPRCPASVEVSPAPARRARVFYAPDCQPEVTVAALQDLDVLDCTTVESDLHIVEIKVRLRPADAALLRALARKRDVPSAVLGREIIVKALGSTWSSVPVATENRRPA